MIVKVDRWLLWLNLLALVAIAFLPFSTAFIARFPGTRAAIFAYGLDLLWFSAALTVLLIYASRASLLAPELGPDVIRASLRRCYVQPIAIIGAMALGCLRPELGLAVFVAIPLLYIATGSPHTVVEPRR